MRVEGANRFFKIPDCINFIISRVKSYREAVKWYQKAAEMTSEDDTGEFDATMDDPVYQLKAAMARLYAVGGFDLDKDPSYAGI